MYMPNFKEEKEKNVKGCRQSTLFEAGRMKTEDKICNLEKIKSKYFYLYIYIYICWSIFVN